MPVPPNYEREQDRCVCGHVRGEHFTPAGSDTQECLLCDCPRFRSIQPDHGAGEQADGADDNGPK